MKADIWGDEWENTEEICFNCKYMTYFSDDYCLMEICTKNDEFTLSTNYCENFKNRWEND